MPGSLHKLSETAVKTMPINFEDFEMHFDQVNIFALQQINDR
jgi:hypothetical protein